MKAAKYEGERDIRIIDIPKPSPQKNEVLVKVKYAGICGSDLEAYKTGLYPAKLVLGHEITGHVSEIGPDVNGWNVGDRVTIFPGLSCGKCHFCQTGHENLCIYEDSIGIGQNGGHAEYVLVKQENLVVLPDSIPDKFGTVFDQLATAPLALRESNFTPGSYCVILGLGTMGQFFLQYLKIAGARGIAVVEKNLHRLETAKKFNPDLAVNKLALAKIKRFPKRSFGGADYVFECSGVPILVNAAIDITRKGGTVVQVGIWDKALEINMLKYVMNQIRIQGAWSYTKKDFKYAVELVANKLVDPEPIITKIISLDDIVEEGFECAIDPETKDIKILVAP
jgi:(R,R)-butanediol dehydrogenase/meso-butanediol dehydrogenase/diacetyl reductase